MPGHRDDKASTGEVISMIDFLKRSLDAMAVSAKASALARPFDRASDLPKGELDLQSRDTDERRRAVPCEEMFYWGMAGGPGY
jgi:hypothetical protein